MSFRVRPINDRLFSKPVQISENNSNNEEENEQEEVVFYVDEETGDIKEEKISHNENEKNVEKKNSNAQQRSQIQSQPKEMSKVFQPKMKQIDKQSFM